MCIHILQRMTAQKFEALCSLTHVRLFRGEFRPRQTRQLPRAVDLKGSASKLSKLLIK